MLERWRIYQRERFPVLGHGPLIAALSLSAVGFSSQVRGSATLPRAAAFFVAFLSVFLFFLQLRIADEFKDRDADVRYRAYRPVPRGLVSLRELGAVGIAAAGVQLAVALLWHPPLAWLLVSVWLYMGLMATEFFAPVWLPGHPVAYLWTHMLVMPLIVLYAAACDWMPAGGGMPAGILWFLFASFFNGCVVEVGRKIRAPKNEEPGVETYTVLWGRQGAVSVWLGVMLLAGIGTALAAAQVGRLLPIAGLEGLLLLGAASMARRFLREPGSRRARFFQPASGLWILITYLSLGAGPFLARP